MPLGLFLFGTVALSRATAKLRGDATARRQMPDGASADYGALTAEADPSMQEAEGLTPGNAMPDGSLPDASAFNAAAGVNVELSPDMMSSETPEEFGGAMVTNAGGSDPA